MPVLNLLQQARRVTVASAKVVDPLPALSPPPARTCRSSRSRTPVCYHSRERRGFGQIVRLGHRAPPSVSAQRWCLRPRRSPHSFSRRSRLAPGQINPASSKVCPADGARVQSVAGSSNPDGVPTSDFRVSSSTMMPSNSQYPCSALLTSHTAGIGSTRSRGTDPSASSRRFSSRARNWKL